MKKIAAIRVNSELNTPALKVGGVLYTKADYLVKVEQVKANMDRMRSIIASDGPTKGNNQKLLRIMEAYTPETIALASLVLEGVIIEDAPKRGVIVSAEEARNFAKEMRTAFEANPNPEIMPLIDAMGKETYWNEYAPKGYEKDLIVRKYKNTFEDGMDFYQTVVDLIETANVNILVKDLMPEYKLSTVRQYLLEYGSTINRIIR